VNKTAEFEGHNLALPGDLTNKWRIETVEINGVIQIGSIRVSAGDIVQETVILNAIFCQSTLSIARPEKRQPRENSLKPRCFPWNQGA